MEINGDEILIKDLVGIFLKKMRCQLPRVSKDNLLSELRHRQYSRAIPLPGLTAQNYYNAKT